MNVTAPLFSLVATSMAVLACSSDGSSTGASSGASTVTPSCYRSADGTACDCQASNDDATRSASDYTKVASCNSSTMSGALSCFVDTTVDGNTSSCSCQKVSCYVSGDRCYCGPASGKTDDLAGCSPSDYEWCCGKNDDSECHCGNGAFGSGCGNEEANVTSCTRSSIRLPSSSKSSCDGLKWTPPPPPSSGGGGGDDGECSSSSECSGKCSTRCYDCRSKSCVCGRIGSSGSCIY